MAGHRAAASISMFCLSPGGSREGLVRHIALALYHDGGLPNLLRSTAVGQVAVTPGYSEQITGLVKSNTPPGRVTPECVELIPGDYTWAGIPVRVVLPDGPGLRGRAGDPGNDSSLVFVLDFCEFRAEFWGDSPSSSVDRALEGNRWLAAPKTASVVKIPHHGSDDAYHPMLYRRLGDDQPLYSVISVGQIRTDIRLKRSNRLQARRGT